MPLASPDSVLTGRAERIHRLASRMVIACNVLIALSPLLLLLAWFWIDPEEIARMLFRGTPETMPISSGVRIALGVLATLALIPWVAALYQLRRLFRLYRDGSFFQRENIAALRGLGWSSVAIGAIDILNTPAVSFLITLHSATGHEFRLSLGSSNVVSFLLGAALLVIAHVMEEARLIEEERAQFI